MNAVQLAAPAPKFRAGDLVTIADHDGIWELIGCRYVVPMHALRFLSGEAA